MNVLDDRLLHSNSAVVMATVKLFLHLTLSMPPTHQQVTFCFSSCSLTLLLCSLVSKTCTTSCMARRRVF